MLVVLPTGAQAQLANHVVAIPATGVPNRVDDIQVNENDPNYSLRVIGIALDPTGAYFGFGWRRIGD